MAFPHVCLKQALAILCTIVYTVYIQVKLKSIMDITVKVTSDRHKMKRQLLEKLDEAIVFCEKTVTPEDRAEACEIVGSLKAKITHL